MLICDFYWGWFPKVYAGAGGHDGGIVEKLSDGDSVVNSVK